MPTYTPDSMTLATVAISTSTSAIYTASVKTMINEILVHNTNTTTARSVKINFVPSGGSVSAATQAFDFDLAARETKIISAATFLPANATLSIYQSTGSDCTATVSGTKVA